MFNNGLNKQIIKDIRTIYKTSEKGGEKVYKRYCELRDKSGMNDYQVAKATGIYQSTFTDWKNGRSNPGVEKLAKIAKVLGCQIEDFLERETA